jgi:hypothetical protein
MTDLKHSVVQAIKAVAADLGRTPSRDEFCSHEMGMSNRMYMKAFGLWGEALKAAGFNPNNFSSPKTKFKYKKSKLESFHIHEIPYDDVFSVDPSRDYVDIMLMPDTHCKHRDISAVECFIKCVEKLNPDLFVILGDFIDAVGISHWPADALEPKRLVPEIIEARELLSSIVRRLKPGCIKTYLTGNHEDWIHQAFVSKLPELFDGLEELGLSPDLYRLLDLEKFGFTLLPVNHFLKISGLYFTHGLYTGNNHPTKHMKAIKAPVFYGHMHDDLQAQESGISGNIEAASCGCLCRLDAPFMNSKPTNWAHGFRRIRLYKDGSYLTEQIRIKNGRCIFMGETISS